MSSLEKICREAVESSSDITGCWLFDLQEPRLIALHGIHTNSRLNDAILEAALSWIRQHPGGLSGQGVTEASISASEQRLYLKASEHPRWGAVLATRSRVSAGIGWAMARSFSARAFEHLQSSALADM